LYVHHGFSTIVNAEAVGRNFWVSQQVTIGSGKGGRPSIGDDVRITAGAKVFGAITIGDRSVIGANAVVLKDVPPDCTVAGVPARIIRRAGIRVDEKLV
jgi:serine O-acetyltransferase